MRIGFSIRNVFLFIYKKIIPNGIASAGPNEILLFKGRYKKTSGVA